MYIKKGGEIMIKEKTIAVMATGVIMLASMTPFAFADTGTTNLTSPVSSVVTTVTGVVQDTLSNVKSLLGGNNLSTATGANVTSENGTTSVDLGNQTSADVLGNTIQATTGVTTQLGL